MKTHVEEAHALWGELEMDYHTVGKDPGACFWTDDTELVESGELRQQTTLCSWDCSKFYGL